MTCTRILSSVALAGLVFLAVLSRWTPGEFSSTIAAPGAASDLPSQWAGRSLSGVDRADLLLGAALAGMATLLTTVYAVLFSADGGDLVNRLNGRRSSSVQRPPGRSGFRRRPNQRPTATQLWQRKF